ncbi:MAG: hypothetical protein ACI4EF_08180, partial [Coprococcus sp.]
MMSSVTDIEDTIAMYHVAYIVCLVLAICMFLCTAIIFCIFRIPKVFKGITGIERKRAIRDMSEHKEYAESVVDTEQPELVNTVRHDEMTDMQSSALGSEPTELLSHNKSDATDVLIRCLPQTACT